MANVSGRRILILFFMLSVFGGSHAWANGSIIGTVSYDGTLPFPKLIHMDADPVCFGVNKGNVHTQSILVGEHNTLKDAFVYIKSGLAQSNYAAPNTDVVITQAGCNYSPHVIGVMVGQKVKFLNPDGTLHNVHAICRINPEFNATMPDFRKEMEITFSKPEFMFPVQCDVHPWMKAWIAVMPHPYFTVTGIDGGFEFNDLPAGTYVLEAWHEKLPVKTVTVTVADNTTQKVNFTF